jgi:tetratricopeptide (TPR) repeat protein
VDYFKAGTTYYYASQFDKGAKIFKSYGDKYPADWRAPFWQARCTAQADSLMQTGEAAAYYEKYIALGGNDPANNKFTVEAYLYLFAVAYNIKKDKAQAVGYLDKVLAIDPQNANALKYKQMLK